MPLALQPAAWPGLRGVHTMRKLTGITIMAAGLLVTSSAAAQVIVNGQLLNQRQINRLTAYSCGPIFPGRYWLNMQTGYWGYAGSRRVMGHIRARCRGTRRKGLSERGLLYSPGELLR